MGIMTKAILCYGRESEKRREKGQNREEQGV